MLIVVGFTIFGYVQKYAYAEELGQDTILNFNQYVKNEY